MVKHETVKNATIITCLILLTGFAISLCVEQASVSKSSPDGDKNSRKTWIVFLVLICVCVFSYHCIYKRCCMKYTDEYVAQTQSQTQMQTQTQSGSAYIQKPSHEVTINQV
jgi:hypothetical protein